ncbi:MAG: hypothetical protein CMI08_11150 [Oceanospirillaceae bacterium]|nr:hypothetical protein [Oceanospirillaceae bacterium]MBS52552.1 hypothetical protein [Oceanospirillaceae bacterium]
MKSAFVFYIFMVVIIYAFNRSFEQILVIGFFLLWHWLYGGFSPRFRILQTMIESLKGDC